MARALNDLKARAFDERRGLPHQGDRGGAVLIADQAKGRRFDQARIGPKVGALQGAASGKIARSRRPREHGANAREFVGAARVKVCGEPALKDRVGDRLDAAALDFSDALIPGFVGSDLRRGVAKHERGDEFRALAIEFLSDHAADGKSDDCGSSDADFIQKRREVARIVGHLARVRSGLGEAVAALIVADDAEVVREDERDIVPDAQVGSERIDEGEGRPRLPPLVEAMDDEAIRPHKPHARRLREASQRRIASGALTRSNAPFCPAPLARRRGGRSGCGTASMRHNRDAPFRRRRSRRDRRHARRRCRP